MVVRRPARRWEDGAAAPRHGRWRHLDGRWGLGTGEHGIKNGIRCGIAGMEAAVGWRKKKGRQGSVQGGLALKADQVLKCRHKWPGVKADIRA
jgi:hypothetical protein